MLWCWWGSSRAPVAVRDDGCGGCAVALLGRQHYWSMRTVAGMGWQAQRCQGRRVAVTELTMMTRTADNATRREGQTTMISKESNCFMTQGNDVGGNNGGGDVMLRASYSQCCPLRL